MNAPERFDIFLLPDDEKKVEIIGQVPGMTNSCVYKINREDHTIGNMLKMELHKNKSVIFVGYKQPHPLKHFLELFIQTEDNVSATDVLNIALSNLINEIGRIKQRFEVEVARNRVSGMIDNSNNPFSSIPNQNRKIDFFPVQNRREDYLANEIANDPYREMHSPSLLSDDVMQTGLSPRNQYDQSYQPTDSYQATNNSGEVQADAGEFFDANDDENNSDQDADVKKESEDDLFQDNDF